ncbi:MAG: helix-turn-helix transcriptional regulator [Eubacteriales bacterium]
MGAIMNEEFEKIVGGRLRDLRMEKGLTQEQVSAQMQVRGCDVTRSALAKIEVGQRHIYVDELKVLREILGTTLEELLG